MKEQAARALPPPGPPHSPAALEKLAQTKFFTAMFDLALRIAARHRVAACDPQDVAQDSVVRIWKGWPTYSGTKGSPNQWAATVTLNEIRRSAKRGQRDPLVGASPEVEGALEGLAIDRPRLREDPEVLEAIEAATPASRAASDHRGPWTELRRKHDDSLLVHLALVDARVVYLRVWLEMTNAEAAAIEGISAAEASRRFGAGIARLDELLSDGEHRGIVPLCLASWLGVERAAHAPSEMVDAMLRNVRAELGLDAPPSTPPDSGMRRVDPRARCAADAPALPEAPSHPRSVPARLVDQVGGVVAGALATVFLLSALWQKDDRRDQAPPPRRWPAGRRGPAPSPRAAAGAAPAPVHGPDTQPAELLRRAAPGSDEAGLIDRARIAARTRDPAAALGALFEHAARFPKGALVEDRAALIQQVCAALQPRDPRCPP